MLMKTRIFTFLICFLTCLGISFQAYADTTLEDGTYYITCNSQQGYLGLGAYHNADAYIYYVTDGQTKTADAYWVVTNTRSGYTFRNEESGQLLVFTYDRVDQYYKYMTVADESLGDKSEYWNLISNSDGTFSVQSTLATNYYWNLRSSGMLGTYSGSAGGGNNEHFTFHKKGDEPDPGPGPDPTPDPTPGPTPDTSQPLVFPDALHVTLADGRLEAYPLEYITKYGPSAGKLVIETNLGQNYTYNLSDVVSYSEEKPTDFPTFESFKFNNKFNDQLFTDAEGVMTEDTVFVTIAAIGKRLTPSFKLPDDENIEVYVNNVRQVSKETRLRFEKDVYYVVTRKGYTMLLPDSDSKGSYSMRPYGRVVRVHVDWLTDRAEVPTIYINTSDGYAITSKTEYKDAEIIIDGHGIFPSMEATPVQIKGRGNSSWGWAKKPYRLKFEEKVKPLGMTKGRSWVLLANGQGGSLMSNAIGMKAANLMKASAANHIVPVDIYLNGEYRGSYNLTEKVGLSNNSVDLDDETSAALLELDSYYDEPEGQKFRSQPYGLPINIKEPDFSEGTTSLTLETISSDFNSFMSSLYRGQDISKHVDIEQLVRFLMVNELIINYEFYHPKSTFCYKESFDNDTSKYIFGPVWDLDWAFGYERSKSYFKKEATYNYWLDGPNMEVVQFVRDLRFKYAPMSEVYKTLWEEFMNNDLTELLEYCQDYYDFAKNSLNANRTVWSDNTDYAAQAVEAQEWLSTRTQTIYDDILSGKRPDDIDPVEPVEFANDKLYTIKCRRGALVLNASHTGLDVGNVRTDAPEEDGQFAIITISDKQYLYSPVTKQYLDYWNNGTWVSQLGSPIIFDNSNADGEYQYMMSVKTEWSGTYYFNNSTTQLVINSWSTPDNGNRWLIEEVDDFDPTEALNLARGSLIAVTNRYLFEGQVVGSEVIEVAKGALPPNPSDEWDNAFVILNEPDNIPYEINDDVTIDYDVQWVGPFQFSKTLENAKWYNMTIRSDYYVGKQDTEPYYPGVVHEDSLRTRSYQWAFGGDPYHVKVYNRTTDFDETLTYVGDNAVMRSGECLWDVLPNSDGFVLRKPGTSWSCLNQFGGNGGPLKFWDDWKSLTDNGSTFRVYEAQEPIVIVKATDIALNRTELLFTAAGDTATLTATVKPDDVTNGGVRWENTNPEVATIDQNGVVTAVANGTTTIFVKTIDGSNLADSCIVTVAIPQLMEITYAVLFDGEVVNTATIEILEGSAMPEPPASLTNSFVTLTPSGTHPTTVTQNETLNFNAVWGGPFEFSKSADDAKWYNMTIRDEYYVGKQESEPYYPQKDAGDLLKTKEYHWAFGGNPYHVAIYNRSTEFEETLTKDGNNAVMRQGTYLWDILPNDGDGFVLRETETANNCIYLYSGALQFWNSASSLTHKGSTFHVEEAQELYDGIMAFENGQMGESTAIYDLSGRRMPSGRLPKGIYIVNGRRVLIK